MAANKKGAGGIAQDLIDAGLGEIVAGKLGGADSPFGGQGPNEVAVEEEPTRIPPLIGGFPEGVAAPNQSPNPNWTPDVIGGVNIAPGRPQYREGQEFSLLGEMNPNQIANIQRTLESLGIIGADSYTPDMLDKVTISGFGNLLGLANANGLSWQAMAAALTSRGGVGGSGGGGGGGATRAPLVTRTSNPDTLKRYLRKAVVEMTGSSQSPDIDIDQMVEAYQQIERDYQKQIYDTQLTGGEVVEPPSFDDYAQGQVEGEFGAEVQANSIAERAGGLLKAIAGGRI